MIFLTEMHASSRMNDNTEMKNNFSLAMAARQDCHGVIKPHPFPELHQQHAFGGGGDSELETGTVLSSY
jgi:hypothetical protein